MHDLMMDKATGRYLPILYPEEMPFWDATRAHVLKLQCCKACGKVWYPIGPNCPFCLARDFDWKLMSGRGTVVNKIVYHKPFSEYYKTRVPYAVVQVELEEGPRLTTNMPGTPLADIKIGMPVQVDFEKVTEDVTLPQFRPRT